ncbi:MAG: CoA transferase [Actinomycetota bacterium]
MEKSEFFRDARDDLTGPLAGVKVLEITSTWAGPMCGVLLADLGAEVIKVEITAGDVARYLIPIPGSEVHLMHATVNRNKRSLAIDMTSDEGRSILLDLAAQSDILVENFKSGVLPRHGLGYDDVKAVKDDIVYVSITGWGQFGPDHEAAGYDPLAQATSGFMTINGSPADPPTKAGSFLADDLSGLHGALGAIAALRHRDQTGEGQYVDIALLDSMMYQTNGLPTLGAMGIQPQRWGNEFGFAVPASVYECTDGPIYAGVLLDEHWKRLAEIIGQPELADHESFATREGRAQNRDVCNVLLSGWLAERSRDEAMELLRPAGLAVARVQTFAEVAADPHVQERDMLQPTEQYDGTTVPIVGPSWKFSRTPARVRTGAPALGQHNDEILAGLGYDDDARQALRDAGKLA